MTDYSTDSSSPARASLLNPVLRGFNPDPSVCRVGELWFMTTSTFTYAPGLPVYVSKDLAHWDCLGHALNRPEQLPLNRCAQHEGIFAPTLRHWSGRFYIVTTSVSNGGNFMITAEDPAGPWSKPVWIDEGCFDPSLFFDTDGTVYYTRKGDNDCIVQARIDPASGKLITPLQPIAKGFVSTDCEGPHLFRRGDTYYLLLAEGGTRRGHMATLGRSSSPWGPFEPCPWNPVLSNRDLTHNTCRSIGHADFFDAPDGSWWAACLGTRHSEYEDFSLLGRESFIVPVSWTEDGWPVANNHAPVTDSSVSLPWSATPPSSARTRLSFAGKRAFDPPWLSLRNLPDPTWLKANVLCLQGGHGSLDDPFFPSLLALRVPERAIRITARISQLTQGQGGLTLYMDHRHHLALCLKAGGSAFDSSPQLQLRMRLGDALAVLHDGVSICLPALFSFRLQGTCCQVSALSESEDTERFLGSWDIRYLAPEVAGTWTGLVTGFFAEDGGLLQATWLEMQPLLLET